MIGVIARESPALGVNNELLIDGESKPEPPRRAGGTTS